MKRTSVTIGAPISANKMYTPSKKYGLVKSKKYRQWIDTNLPLVKNGLDKATQFPVKIKIIIMEGYGFTDRSDIDNVIKSAIDLLVKAEIIPDDNIKYIKQCEAEFMAFWTKKSEAITCIRYIEEYMPILDQIREKPHTNWNVPDDRQPLEKFVAALQFTTGEFLFNVSDFDLDTDGKRSLNVYDSDHQDATSIDPEGTYVDANEIPYVVLPYWLAEEQGIALGTLCTVFLGEDGENHAHAIYADNGPSHKLGEGSLKLYRLLGQERVDGNNNVINQGMGQTVRVLFYPKIVLSKTNTSDEIQSAGHDAILAFIS